MKKLIIILLFPLILTAQQVAIGFDVRNALIGSDVNCPSLDVQLKISDITPHREIGLEFEYFKEIDYFSYGVYSNYLVNVNSFQLAFGGELIQIIRGKFTSFAYGFNGEIRYFITDKIGVSTQYNIRRRTDLQLLYNDGRFVNSGFVNLIYKWK